MNRSVSLVLVLVFLTASCIVIIQPLKASGDSWEARAPMPTARFSFGVAVANGKIYAIGGAVNSSSALLAVNEEYDPILNKWTEKAPMPTPRYGFATVAYDNKIYVFGGGIDNNSTLTDETLVYDPKTDGWVAKAPMPLARMLCQANVVKGEIYLIGGYPYPNATLNEAYDPATDTWTTKAPIPIPAIACASAVVDDEIYVISGANFENATSPLSALTSTQVYDPKTDTWSSGAPIPTPLDSAGVGVITDADGRKAIYVVGGETDIFSPQSIVQIYFPQNNSWNIGSSLPIPRSRLCAAVANNELYAIGGTRTIGHQGLSGNEQYTLPEIVPNSSPSPSPSITEFPSWIILSVLAIAMLLAFISVRFRKKAKTPFSQENGDVLQGEQ
jgi:N-acetylneuraminic acid mutarotase